MALLNPLQLYSILVIQAFLVTSVHSQTQQECTPMAGQNLTFTRNVSTGGPSYISFQYNKDMKNYSSLALDCVWRVTAPPGMFLTLSFGSLVIHRSDNCKDDYLDVREGTNESGHQYGKVCGWSTPDNIYSVGQDIFIRFHSSLFHLEMNTGFTIILMAQKIVSSCSEYNTDASNMNIHVNVPGVITSPGYGITDYPHNMKCIWRIAAPQGYIIKMRILDIDIKAGYYGSCTDDQLNIFDDLYSTGNRNIGLFCGKKVPSTDLFSSSNQLMVYFKSSVYSGSFTRGKGFKAELYSLKTESTGSCTTQNSSSFGGMGGTFVTPNYPLPYPKHAVCTWTITVPTGYHLKLTISHFSVNQGSQVCTSGYFYLVAGNNATVNTTLGMFCGSTSYYPKVLYIRGNILWAKFFSSVERNDWSTGVRASYEALEEVDEATICSPFNNATLNDNLTLTDLPGTLTSPNYPATYPRSMQCTWTVSAPPGKRIRLTINDIYMGPSPACQGGYLQVGDGDSTTSAPKAKMCNIISNVYSTGRHMWLRFHSDSETPYRGFSLDYIVTELCDSLNSEAVNNDIRMTSSKGNFTSPKYPGFYPPYMQCTWKITVPHGKRVRLRLTHFSIGYSSGCNYGDYVQVRNGLEESSSEIGKYCGFVEPGNIYSTGNQMWVRLKSDGVVNGNGFKAEFDAVNEVNVGAIAGGVVAGAIVFIAIIGITVYCIQKKRPPTASQRSASPCPAARPIYPPQGRTYVDEQPAPIMHGVYPPSEGGYQNPGYPQQQPSPYQQRAGPYPTQAGAYPTQAAPYPTQAGAYPTQAAPYPTQAAPYTGPPPAYDQAPPKDAAPNQALVPPTSVLPVATPHTPSTPRAPLLDNEEVPL